jgi:hypothetical protein
MVEITLPIMLQIVQTVGILVGIIYYLSIMRNQQKTRELTLESQELTRKAQEQTLETRQAQLLMNLYEAYRNPTFKKQFDHVLFRMEFEDWEDFNKKLDPLENPDERVIWFSVLSFFDGVGVLLKRKLIDIALIDDLLATAIRYIWEKMGPFEIESRKRLNQPRAWDDFEYLYNELMKYHEEHPELKT